MWKSPVDCPSDFQYGGPQHARDIYPSHHISSSIKGIHWSNLREAVTESCEAVTDKESGEKRRTNGYRLFGIELLEHSTVDETSPVAEQRHIFPLDVESDWRSDIPSASCDPEKSSMRSQELHTRQIRSCTKVGF